MQFPFIPVSHQGTHAEVSKLILTYKEKEVRIRGNDFYFDIHLNSVEDYFLAYHQHELKTRNQIYLNIYWVHAGTRVDMAWSAQIKNKDLVWAKEYKNGCLVECA